eukprot:TRINITY_DN15322_c0_g1_i1.p1 TRINITY_DN15322_c0_g1~~TRINITY_DN15322_c0_g1_i1.p1  ORF type:complete len:254 (-),score=58.46 TRINITY_DN15322_c0_g1_i1:149-910(-)
MARAYKPLSAHPLFGKTLLYQPDILPAETAEKLFADASAGSFWQDSTALGRMTASFTHTVTLSSISYYEPRISAVESWHLLQETFQTATELLAKWLPPDFAPRVPNYVLANWYSSPLANARWHQDVPEAIADWILSISLGGQRMFLLQELAPGQKSVLDENDSPIYYILLPHNSALLMGPGVNLTHYHCIPPCDEQQEAGAADAPSDAPSDVPSDAPETQVAVANDNAQPSFVYDGPRLNLTFRHVWEDPEFK